jgi:hypothetical protein
VDGDEAADVSGGKLNNQFPAQSFPNTVFHISAYKGGLATGTSDVFAIV